MSWQQAVLSLTLKRFPWLLSDPNSAVPIDAFLPQLNKSLTTWADEAKSPVMWWQSRLRIATSGGRQGRPDRICRIFVRGLELCPKGIQMVIEVFRELRDTQSMGQQFIDLLDHIYRCPGGHCYQAMQWAVLLDLLERITLALPREVRTAETTPRGRLTSELIDRLSNEDLRWCQQLIDDLRIH